jgi:hypothetical protein
MNIEVGKVTKETKGILRVFEAVPPNSGPHG